MSSGADAVDQAVSLSLKGIEVMARISGEGAKNLATYLYAVLTDQKKTRGKIRLEGLLRSGKELKVFAVRNEDLQKFTQEAKRYGVLYCALRDKKDTDGMCDIMVRAEDAPRSTASWNASSWPPWTPPASRAKSRNPGPPNKRKKRPPKRKRPPKKARTIFWTS
ncbi:hypothetical protein P378_09075 [Desulforamulus profundi]|uniref:PcfB family protein n=1 Tax=Desulforamulus profundi TaxID=1383067 RepID=A0A2C6MGX5_9FIRM|nr:hypothetical protein P378_09075 [Desulforamulus profundi]